MVDLNMFEQCNLIPVFFLVREQTACQDHVEPAEPMVGK